MSFGSCLRTRLFRTVSAFVFCCLLAPFSLAADGVDLGTSPEQSLQNGLKLETNRRWFESVRHYEQATRKWPEDRTLEQRLMVCRVHADVERRYLDHSFLRTVDETSTDRALELYSEVLTQLESDYVHKVDWAMLQRHGTAFLEVALTEPQFLKKHLANVQPEIIEDFRLHVHEYIANRPQRTRFDVRDTAAYVAGLARQKLGLSGGATVLEYVCGAVGLLDPYTRFLTPQQLDETLSNIKGNFVGLGVELKCETEHLRIVSVIRGGPADQAGIKAGDKILAVNQATVGEYAAEAVADMLRGPEGSYVDLKLARTGGNVDAMQLQRRRVEVPCIENVHMADPAAGVGYLRLTAFQETTVTDLDRALWDLQRQGMQSLIIDLRGNPGGLLQASVDAADRFLTDGKIVSTVGRKPSENFEYQAHRSGTWSIPLLVLVDHDSASASEIFAGAIQDQHRGRIVGETSYGKGSVQGIFHMHSCNVGLCVTTAKFYSPSGREINRRGITPDEEVTEESLLAANGNPPVTVLRPDLTQAKSATVTAVEPTGEQSRDLVLEHAVGLARQAVAAQPNAPAQLNGRVVTRRP